MHEEFETFLIKKNIDSLAFRKAEPYQWESWRKDFEQMHPNSFTVQKLNLINPVRRRYTLKASPEIKPPAPGQTAPQGPPAVARPGKPVMKPRPKIN